MQWFQAQWEKERVHFEAPVGELVPNEMNQLLVWFNNKNDLDPLVKSAIAHLWFVTIHPFDDGNGRIARAIADMQLARADGTSQRFTACQHKSGMNANLLTIYLRKPRKAVWT